MMKFSDFHLQYGYGILEGSDTVRCTNQVFPSFSMYWYEAPRVCRPST